VADALGEAATATRGEGLAAPGDAAGVRTGVGIGVRMLRVSVAAAPGTGVGSAPNRVEQPAATTEAVTATAITAHRTTTLGV